MLVDSEILHINAFPPDLDAIRYRAWSDVEAGRPKAANPFVDELDRAHYEHYYNERARQLDAERAECV